MKFYLLMLLLLPLCSAKLYNIKCMGEDFLMVAGMELDCSSKVEQACYTKDTGEKGCTTLANCNLPGWTCCHTNLCNN